MPEVGRPTGSESAPDKHRGLKEPWQPGRSGNPSGRAKGSRNKLGEQFIADLYADWAEHGASVITEVRREQPGTYLKVVASILPREIKVTTEIDDLDDDELDRRIRLLAAALSLDIRGEEGIGGASGGEETSPRH